jgi:CO/xanthine dehydrogenase FAD-binding subunit
MPKRPTAYYRPENLTEALRRLRQPDTFALAGGTQLLAAAVNGAVVDLQALGLSQIEWPADENEFVQIGATTRLADLADFMQQQEVPAGLRQLLQTAVQRAGPNTIRHAATVGGVVAGRLPDSELLAALLTLDARLTYYPDYGAVTAVMTLADYLQGDERPAGLITTIEFSAQDGRGAGERVARTPADYPIVAVTGWRTAVGAIRLAATGLDERPVRLSAVEKLLSQRIDAQSLEAAATAVAGSCRHPGDFRGDAAYRAAMGAVLVRRVLNQLSL